MWLDAINYVFDEMQKVNSLLIKLLGSVDQDNNMDRFIGVGKLMNY